MKLFHALSIVTALSSVGPAFARDEPIVIKFSHVVAETTPKGQAIAFFKKRAEELTSGRVNVQIYANSQLYKDKEEIEALQLGAVDMIAPTLSKFGPLGIRDFEVFDLPYIFDDFDKVHKVTRGPVGRMLLGKLQRKGITGLAFWDAGFKPFYANRPIRTPEDMQGLKMRIASSKVIDAQMRALDTLPQTMALSEVYTALQTGVVDGTENVATNFYTQKMYEVQKYMTLTNHGYVGYAVVANKNFWEHLPADIRARLEQAMDEATTVANDEALKEQGLIVQAIKDTGKTEIIDLSPAQRAAFKAKLLPVHRAMASRIGAETMDAVYVATDFSQAKF